MSVTYYLAALLAAGAPHGPATRPTDVRSGYSDDLTEKFAEALRAALPKAKHMRLESGDDADDLYLSMLSPVESDGKRFTYSVDLLRANPPLTPDRLASFTGTCREDAMARCAESLIDKADGKAKD